ncbi:hypothetical protein BH23BAC3_BH23BAC3_06050 [soil metagenome]
MKTLAIFFLVFLISPNLLFAQDTQHEPRLEVMTSVASSLVLDKIELMILLPDDTENSYQFSSGEENSGMLMITGTPFSDFEMRITSETSFENQHGMTAVMEDYQLMSGSEPDSEVMEVISPSECSQMTMPESGELYIRIGGTVEAEEMLRGVYTGTLSLSCTDD